MAKKAKRPTKEELDNKITEVIEETKDLTETPEDPSFIIPKEPEVEPEAVVKPDEPEEEAEPSEEIKEKLKVELEEKNKKLSASARENQKIYAKNRVITKALVDADDVQDPTEDELKAEYDEWDVMSNTERKFAKDAIINRKWRETIRQAKDQATKIEKWNDSVEAYISDPKTLSDNPELEGKEESFVAFATTEENNSVPFKLLVSAFLHDHQGKTINNKGSMFETGTGGPNVKPIPVSNKLSLDESRKLRETDYNKWKEYVKENRIETEF